MKSKFPKSSISISGSIVISKYQEDCCDSGEITVKKIEIGSLKQSKSGVYCLRNKLNGRLYIGMARNLEVRKARHWNDLIMGKHINKLLLQDYMSSPFTRPLDIGLKSEVDELFEFEVIIYCRRSELTFYEHLLITHLNPYYNIHKQKEIKLDNPTAIGNYIDEEWEDINEE